MPQNFDSSLTGWDQALAGTSTAWATSVAEDDIGPTRQPMRSTTNRQYSDTLQISKPSKPRARTDRQPQDVDGRDAYASVRSGSAV